MSAVWVAVGAFLLAFIYFYPLTLRFTYKNRRAELHWLPRLCGGFAAPRAVPLRQLSGRDKPVAATKSLLQRWPAQQILPLLRRLLSHVCVEHLHCRLQVGGGSPFAGSLLLGLALAAFGGASGAAASFFKRFPPAPRLELTAMAQGGFNASVECILCIRCGDIIGDTLYCLWQNRRRKKKHLAGCGKDSQPRSSA